jgi:hypothetical protein
MIAAPIMIIFRMVHIVTSSNLRCAKTLAEQLHSLPYTEIRGAVASWTTPSVTKNTPIPMTLIGRGAGRWTAVVAAAHHFGSDSTLTGHAISAVDPTFLTQSRGLTC